MELEFFKYHGTGNDFVLFDNRDGKLRGDEYDYFAWLCHRRFGVGADGVILLAPHAELDFEMVYFNSDGRPSSMCGNGGRCIVQFAHDLGLIGDHTRFMAVDGLHEARLEGLGVRLKMGLPTGYRQLNDQDHWIDTGSPHYVRFQDSPVADTDVFREGRAIRQSPPFAAEGTNVNFAQMDGDVLHVRTYERGVEDETWSCGTGVTAVAECYARIHGMDGPIRIQTPGGQLQVHVKADGYPWLEGPAQFVFSGSIQGPQS